MFQEEQKKRKKDKKMWMFAESFTEEYEELEALKKELAEEQAEEWAGYDEWLDSLPPYYELPTEEA